MHSHISKGKKNTYLEPGLTWINRDACSGEVTKTNLPDDQNTKSHFGSLMNLKLTKPAKAHEECVYEKTRQNQAGGDNAQITDFAQTRHKC